MAENPLNRDCPHCNTPAGQPCKSPRGRKTITHAARRNPQAPPPAHRPTILTPELTETLCNNLRLGAPLNMAAQAAGVSIATVYRWLAEADTEPPNGPTPLQDFREQITRARAQAGITNLARINQAAQRHLRSEEPVTYTDSEGKVHPVLDRAGNPVVKRVWEMDWRAGAFILERSFARDFGRREVVELSAADSVEPTPAVPGAAGVDGAGVERIAASIAEFRARKELEAARAAEGSGGPVEGTVTNR